MALTEKLRNIADAIRGKTGGTDLLTLDEMAEAIAGIQTGGGEVDHSIEDGLITQTIAEYYNDRVTEIGGDAFRGNKILRSVSFPNVTKFSGTTIFCDCSALVNVSIPKLTTPSGGNDFTNCTALKELRFPLLERSFVAASCDSLELADLGNLGYMTTNMFRKCASLSTVILRRTDRKTGMQNVSCFDGTPFAVGGTGGTVYVPQALIEEYQQATNWSTLYEAGTCNFVAIEGSEYE